MDLRKIDLNLLVTLDVLLDERSVSAASDKLCLSQPAVSHALARLRKVFGDPLLVRVGKHMEPTARARRLHPNLKLTCATIQSMLVVEKFQPSIAAQTFTVACPDHMALLLGEKLLPTLISTSPNVNVRFVDVNENIREQIMSREVDVAVIAHIPELLIGLSVANCYLDPLVCVAGRGHPLATRKYGHEAELAKYKLLEIFGASRFTPQSVRMNASEQISVSASHLIVLPMLAARTGTLACVPRSMAMIAAEHLPLTIIELDEPDTQLQHCLAWNPADDSDSCHTWFRGILDTILKKRFLKKKTTPKPPSKDQN